MFIHLTDPQGRNIEIVVVESERFSLPQYHVEVVKRGDVVDNFTLNGHEAFVYTRRKRRWKERKS